MFTLIFAAYSGTGKTTLLEQVVRILCQRGYRIGVVKHSHHDLELDKPGKDSYRLRKAGAVQGVLVTPWRSVVFHENGEKQEAELQQQLALLDMSVLDMVLVEGFRHAPWPKIELHRCALGKPFLHSQDEYVQALVWDGGCDDQLALPQLDINQPQQVADYVEKCWHDYQESRQASTPSLD
ncbi:hypothetical protein WH50_09490 [Pokkaliibacter plantistimulans]|uniref:Molybdopterin-guanine dinucleotide biosynthesis protein B (MobB) domain-containing protein n=1 Tax=Pokkaliibacter plantistimulans TaxID=1635171 RepID=A0ABX5M1Z9_9GAMM|nr:molybdopterin-guanine dinucleotide biosynthesis protein B [Pokkaliibacter plantistimulans]PXF31528.1 hypothetical protein WH50_09490 [Pokkaliibacter plantistimulans]